MYLCIYLCIIGSCSFTIVVSLTQNLERWILQHLLPLSIDYFILQKSLAGNVKLSCGRNGYLIRCKQHMMSVATFQLWAICRPSLQWSWLNPVCCLSWLRYEWRVETAMLHCYLVMYWTLPKNIDR